MSDIDYQCVCCGCAPLEKLRTSFRCTRCTAQFPILFNTPLFFTSIRYCRSEYHMHRDTATSIARRMGLEVNGVTYYVLHQIYSYDYCLPDREMRARDSRLVVSASSSQAVTSAAVDKLSKFVSVVFEGANGERYGVGEDIHTLQVLQLALGSGCERVQLVAADNGHLPIPNRVRRWDNRREREAAA